MTSQPTQRTCSTCHAPMLSGHAWRTRTSTERAQLLADGWRRHHGRGVCVRCTDLAKRRHKTSGRYTDAELRFNGGWRRRRGVLIPTGINAADRLDLDGAA